MSYIQKFLRDERGDISLSIMGMVIVFCLSMFIFCMIYIVPVYSRMWTIYNRMDFAMGYAVSAALHDQASAASGSTENIVLLPDVADVKEYFIDSFAKVNNGAADGDQITVENLPEPITVESITAIEPGDSIPPLPVIPGAVRVTGITAHQPGYVVTLSVPIWDNAFFGHVETSMQCYRMTQTSG